MVSRNHILAILQQKIIGDGQGYPDQGEREDAAEAIWGLIEPLRTALAECASDFVIGDQDAMISRDVLLREFSRRQQIAADALEN